MSIFGNTFCQSDRTSVSAILLLHGMIMDLTDKSNFIVLLPFQAVSIYVSGTKQSSFGQYRVASFLSLVIRRM